MKRSYLLVLAGGVLTAAAFFLPFITTSGIFGSGISLQRQFQNDWRFLLVDESPTPDEIIAIILITVLEPLSAILLLAGGLLAPRLGRSLYVWGLSGAVLSLTFLLWHVSSLYGGNVPYQPGLDLGDILRFVGIGYWLAVIGGALGLFGALLGWLSGSAQTAAPMQPLAGSARGRTPLNRAAIALELLGCLTLIVGCFLPSFVPGRQESLFDLLNIPYEYLTFWPDLLAIVLLLAGGLFALTSRKGAHLASLSGALTGLVMEVMIFVFLTPASRMSITFWVTVAGCLVGLVGAVVGLRARPAAPIPAQVMATPVPF
jgi:hypothetical protein